MANLLKFIVMRNQLSNMELGMDYDQLGPSEKEWVRDAIDNDPGLLYHRKYYAEKKANKAKRKRSPSPKG